MKTANYIHRPCAGIALALAVGIAVESIGHLKMPILILLTAGAFVLAFILHWIKWLPSVLIVYITFAFCGMIIQDDAHTLPENNMGHWTHKEAGNVSTIEGIVGSPTVVRKSMHGLKTSFELVVKEVCFDEHQCVKPLGRVLVNVFREEKLNYGDRIIVSGKLHKPFVGAILGHYSYEDYLERNGIFWIFSVGRKMPLKNISPGQGNRIQALVFRLHTHLRSILESHLNEFEAGFIQSLVLGGKYYMDTRTRDLFVQTGTAHILAISGMNVASMALLIFIFLNVFRLPRRGQILFTIAGLVFYCVLTGSNASVVRAVVMAIVFLTGFLVEREQDTLNSLGIAALVILIIDPSSLFDVGFQLSFAGVFSIVCLYPRVWACVESRLKTKMQIVMGQMLCVSVAAWIGTLPLIGFYFQVITPVSVLANIPIIPFITALFMLGVGIIVCGLLLPPLTGLFSACVKVVLWGLMVVIELFSHIPYGSFFVKEMSIPFIAVYYVLVGAAFVFLKNKDGLKDQGKMLHYLN